MASSKFDNVWNLLTNYSFNINGEDCDDVLCTLCKRIMIDPYTASCGCHYCFCCIEENVAKGGKHCPGQSEECSDEVLVMETNILRDFVVRRKIANLTLKCPNSLCTFETKLHLMEDHIRICLRQSINCPYQTVGCAPGDLKEDCINDHMQLNRLTHSRLIIEAINHLRNDFQGLQRMDTMNDIGEGIERLRNVTTTILDKETNRECAMKNIGRQIAEWNDDRTRILEEMKEIKENSQSNVIGSMKDLMDHNNGLILKLRQDVEHLKEEIGVLKNNDGGWKYKEAMKDDTADLLAVIHSYETERAKMNSLLIKYNEELKESKAKIMELTLKMSHDFVWTINGFSEKNDTWYESEPFYKDNYKLNLRAWINNNNDGYLLLVVDINSGVRDHMVRWPMTHSFIVSIVEKISLKIAKYWIKVNDMWSVFNRPSEEIRTTIYCGDIRVVDLIDWLSDDSLIVCFSMFESDVPPMYFESYKKRLR